MKESLKVVRKAVKNLLCVPDLLQGWSNKTDTYVRHRIGSKQKGSGQLIEFPSIKNAELVVSLLFWPVKCIGGHVARQSGSTIYSLYCV